MSGAAPEKKLYMSLSAKGDVHALNSTWGELSEWNKQAISSSKPRVSERLPEESQGAVLPMQSALPLKGPVDSPSFRLLQYNILAKSLGSNEEPWFMYGGDLSEDDRGNVDKKYNEYDGDSPKYDGFENYAQDLEDTQRSRIQEVSQQVFDWAGKSRRGERLARLIAGYFADIVILEEMDSFYNQTDEDLGLFSMIDKFACENRELEWRPIHFEQDGSRKARGTGVVYDSYFAQRGGKTDGVAILWNRARFELIVSQRHPFDGPREDRVLGMVLLKDIQMDKRLLVLGTHLERNPEADEKEWVRYSQILEAVGLAEENLGSYDAVVFAGDMNSDSLKHGWTAAMNVIREDLKQPFAEAFWDMLMDEKFRQMRAEMSATREHYIPHFCTSRTEIRHVWIDYVFYSPQALQVVQRSGPELCPDHAIPSYDHPSDHVPMEAVFAWNTTLGLKGKEFSGWDIELLKPLQMRKTPVEFRVEGDVTGDLANQQPGTATTINDTF